MWENLSPMKFTIALLLAASLTMALPTPQIQLDIKFPGTYCAVDGKTADPLTAILGVCDPTTLVCVPTEPEGNRGICRAKPTPLSE
jgi:hypothetical protein